MRSKQLWRFHNYISELNTHYSHFLFISQEFIDQNIDGIKKKPESEVKNSFSKNIYASQFNVKLGELSKEFENTKQFILRSLFMLSYFQFEIYLRDIFFFFKKFFTDMPELIHTEAVITQINKLGLLKELDKSCIDTIDYLRLRRNAIVHRDENRVAQGDFLDFINHNGNRLKLYWQEKRKQQERENAPYKNKKRTTIKIPEIRSLDFAPKKEKKKGAALYKFSNDEVIDLLNLMRYLSETIDKHFLDIIGMDKLKDSLITEFESIYNDKERTKHHLLNNESKQRKLRHFLMTFYGIDKAEFDSYG